MDTLRSQIADRMELLFYRNMCSKEAAETFCVSERTVQRVLRQFNGSGTVKETRTLSSRYRELLKAAETVLLSIVFDNPGIYLDEMKSTCEGLT